MEQNFKEYIGYTNEIVIFLRLIEGIYAFLRSFILKHINIIHMTLKIRITLCSQVGRYPHFGGTLRGTQWLG